MQNRGSSAATAVNNEIPLVHQGEDGLVSILKLKKPVHPVANISEDLGQAGAINLVERWIRAEFPRAVPEAWWADKLTTNIKNLGLVIGKQYKDSTGRVVASYRVDWDPEKGLHFNINTIVEKFVFRFGFLRNNILVIDERIKNNMSKSMTHTALVKNECMPWGVAFNFKRHVEMTPLDDYFTTVLGGWYAEDPITLVPKVTLLKRLYNNALAVLASNDKENSPTQNGLSGPKMG